MGGPGGGGGRRAEPEEGGPGGGGGGFLDDGALGLGGGGGRTIVVAVDAMDVIFVACCSLACVRACAFIRCLRYFELSSIYHQFVVGRGYLAASTSRFGCQLLKVSDDDDSFLKLNTINRAEWTQGRLR